MLEKGEGLKSADPAYDRQQPMVWVALGAIMVLSIALRLAFLHEPFERDEGFYSAIALQILEGGVPYRDGVDQKGPLLFYLYAFGMAVFGKTMAAIRVFTALYNLITLLGVYTLARSVSGAFAGLTAAALYAIASSLPHLQAASSNAEIFLAAPVVWSAVCLLNWHSSGNTSRLAIAGAANCAALLIKIVAAPYSLLALAFVIWCARANRSVGRALLVFIGPQVAMVGLVAAFFAGADALADMIHFTVLAPLNYVRAEGVTVTGPGLALALGYLRTELLPFSLLALALPLIRPWFHRMPGDLFLAALPLAAVAMTLLPGKNFPHYFVNLLPFFSAATAVAIFDLLRAPKAVIRMIAVLPLALLIRLAAAEHEYFWRLPPDEVSRLKYGPDFVVARDIGDYVGSNSAPGDYIFQWGFEPQIYLISGRRIPGRFIASTILVAMPDQLAARAELAGDLRESMPAYIIVFPQWAGFPGREVVADFIQRQGYYLERQMGAAYLYRRPT